MLHRVFVVAGTVIACTGPGPSTTDGGTSSTSDSTPPTTSTVSVPGCDDPTLRDSLGPFERQSILLEAAAAEWVWGTGLLAGDFDGDGRVDLWVTSESGIRGVSLGEDGSLTEVPTGLPDTPSALASHGGGVGGAVADYDGDGDLDVYVTRWEGSPRASHAEAGRNRLFRNDEGTFVDVTEDAGVAGCSDSGCLRSTTASFGDADGDGHLDLFVGAYGVMPGDRTTPEEPSFLFLNDGKGGFTDATERLPPIAHVGYALAGGFVDLDRDADLDLYIVNDIGTIRTPNVALTNDGTGHWSTRDEDGLAAALDGMGMAQGDLNGDGRPDFLVPGWGNAMYLQSVPGRDLWAESSQAAGLWIRVADIKAGMDIGWGSTFADLDNDGDLDALTQYGPFLGASPEQPDAVWRNDGTPTTPSFTLASEAFDADDLAPNRGVAVLDLDRDGWLDLVKPSLDGTLTVQRARCGREAWLGVTLDQPGPNPDGVGAVVEVVQGDQRWSRTVSAGGSSFGVALPPDVHLGLGMVERVDDVVVHWPNGTTTSLGPTDTRQWITVRP